MMGVGIYPVFDLALPAVQFDSDGKVLAREFKALDIVAAAAGLPAFSAFGDTRPVPEGFAGDRDELYDLLGPWEEWFPTVDGLRVIEGLLGAIEEGTESEALDDPEEVADELRELARCLRAAAEAGARFRLEMG
jgi:hypothetical protein